ELLALVAELVRPGRADGRATAQPDHGRNRGVGAELMPAIGGVEIMIAVDAIEEARRIVGEDRDIDADLPHGLREELRPELGILAPRRRTVTQPQANAVGARLVARLVEQGL